MAPFSAITEPTQDAYVKLAADLPDGVEVRLFRPTEEPDPARRETISTRPIVQMVADATMTPCVHHKPDTLSAPDVPAMLALVELTEPGPFRMRTHMLRHYVGYRDGGRLLAMGGGRLRLTGFVELGTMCVQPDARGRGLGAAIRSDLAYLAASPGETALLHVFPHNPAIAPYRQLGFHERARLWVIWRRPR
jgi:predicted GNAT family acetyltransferase